ncbi:MAG: hypothetical protein QUU85_13610, partial [Candidatus Eisenbacteria bacterium]|nr:hypothetical protein [Candidatus Eisenbacteria bacterium]
MNQLLLAALAVSGAFDLVAGIWAIVRPSNFASFWLGTDVAEPSLVIPIVAVGLGALALSLLHLVAIHWLRKEKKEAYGLSISLGGGLTVAALFLVLYRVLGHQPLNLALELIAEGARGAALAVIGIAARNAPATVKELRLPKERVREARGRDRRMDQREVRGGGRGGRSGGHGRDRDRDREHDFGQRRERGRRGGREGREAAAPVSYTHLTLPTSSE